MPLTSIYCMTDTAPADAARHRRVFVRRPARPRPPARSVRDCSARASPPPIRRSGPSGTPIAPLPTRRARRSSVSDLIVRMAPHVSRVRGHALPGRRGGRGDRRAGRTSARRRCSASRSISSASARCRCVKGGMHVARAIAADDAIVREHLRGPWRSWIASWPSPTAGCALLDRETGGARQRHRRGQGAGHRRRSTR